MKVLIVLAIIVAVFWLIGCIRLGGRLSFDDKGFFVWVLAGPAKIQVVPLPPKKPDSKPKKPKKEKPKKPKPEKPKKPPKPKKPKPEGQPGTVQRLLSLIPTVLEAVGRLRSRIQIDEFDLDLHWGGSDAASIAIGYGQANAIIGSIWPTIEKSFVVKHCDINIDMDYGRTSPAVEVAAAFTITIGQVVSIAVSYAIRLLILWIRSGRPAA